MSATLEQNKSNNTGSASQNITPGDRLVLAQASLNELDKIPGVRVLATTIHAGGQQTAAIILTGCKWDDGGNLVLA